MTIEFVKKDNISSIKLTTNDTASILKRYMEIPLNDLPNIKWKWLVEKPIISDLDEKTKEGDDHPARFFIGFKNEADESRHMEIIWGNKLKKGEYKYLGTFPHYVARGGDKNINKWFEEDINLLESYKKIWGDEGKITITEIGIFCDSDDTNDSSISYFADVELYR